MTSVDNIGRSSFNDRTATRSASSLKNLVEITALGLDRELDD